MRTRPATTIGAAAAGLLAGGGEGRVIAVFERSVYVAFAGGLVCVGPSDFGPGPLHLLASFDGVGALGDHLAVGDAATVRGTVLRVADFGFDVAGLAPWRPAPPAPLDPADLALGLDRLARAVERRVPVGLGVLVEGLCRGQGAGGARLEPLLRPAAPVIAALADWACTGGHGDAVPDPTALVGLGPGLTPSGDDFLAGFLVALRRLGRGEAADTLAAVVAPIAARATNTISAAHLALAAEGEISARLIDVLDRIAAGGDCEALLDRVEAIGHTSGWDGLAGLVAGAAAVVDRALRGRPVL